MNHGELSSMYCNTLLTSILQAFGFFSVMTTIPKLQSGQPDEHARVLFEITFFGANMITNILLTSCIGEAFY